MKKLIIVFIVVASILVSSCQTVQVNGVTKKQLTDNGKAGIFIACIYTPILTFITLEVLGVTHIQNRGFRDQSGR